MAVGIWQVDSHVFLRLYCQKCGKVAMHMDADLPVAARAALKTYLPGLKKATDDGKALGMELSGLVMVCDACQKADAPPNRTPHEQQKGTG